LKLFLIITLWTLQCGAQNLDHDILRDINAKGNFSNYWLVTSSSAYWVPAFIGVNEVAAGFINKDWAHPAGFGISIGIGLPLTMLLKAHIGRMRPYNQYDDIRPYKIMKDSSMPSGHTMMAFLTAATLSVQFQKWSIAVPSMIWASTVGYSRMYLGEHFPSDVLAGMLIGTGSAILGNNIIKH